MTDPGLADATYIEPIYPGNRRQASSKKERPDALLPTMGAQTGLKMSLASRDGCAEKIQRRDDRAQSAKPLKWQKIATFPRAMDRLGIENPKGNHRPQRRFAASGQKGLAAGVQLAAGRAGLCPPARDASDLAFTMGGTGRWRGL